MSDHIPEKLRKFINMAFGDKPRALADALGIDRSNVYKWLEGRELRSSMIAGLFELGLSIDWLVDRRAVGTESMFADNENGKKLHEIYHAKDESA